MRALFTGGWLASRGRGIVSLVLAVVFAGALAAIASLRAAEEQGRPPASKATIALGGELFHREWVPGDERSLQGDGLGPVYNDTSCVACHNLGAVGGGGPTDKNIVLLSAIPLTRDLTSRVLSISAKVNAPPSPTPAPKEAGPEPSPAESKVETPPAATPTTTTVVTGTFEGTPAKPSSGDSTGAEKLTEFHPGFKTASSVVLHRFGTNPEYLNWRSSLARPGGVATSTSTNSRTEMSQLQREALIASLTSRRSTPFRIDGNVRVIPSERNPTSLFGAGLIEAIPAREIAAVATEQGRQAEFSEIQGRACRLKDGRIGRFGWKGQMASLDDFVLNACAVELGLEVPGHAQTPDPLAPEAKAKGLDLTAHECAALTAYVANLPRPAERTATGEQEATRIARGRGLFASTGCATCHRPALGEVTGIYSDLLLHNMGLTLADSGAYGANVPDSSEEAQPGAGPGLPVINASLPAGRRPAVIGATRQEWRTPPLWGLRDSAPYLHDGRAATIEHAIALHGGEGQKTAQRFFALASEERLQLMAFLKSLVAPIARGEAGG